MRLVYLLTSADAKAGTERTFADQTRAMSERGHEVGVISVYRREEPGFDYGPVTAMRYVTDDPGPSGAPSLVIPQEWDDQFSADVDRALLDHLAGCDADIVITSTPALTVYALLGLPAHVRIVQEEHRPSLARGVTAIPLLRHGPSVDAVVSLTQRDATWLGAQWGDRAPRIEVIPNALPDTGRPISGRRQKVIMGAGRLVRSKGFADLIRAFAVVAPEFPEWRLRIFGDGPEAPALRRLVRTLAVVDQVDLMPPTTDIEREWARASIGALASRYEGLPLVLLEARGAHLPLVAYDCETGPREIIEHGTDGYLVPVGDIAAFADSLRPLMADDRLRDRMGDAAPENLRRFAPAAVARQWEDLLQELASRPSLRSRTEPDPSSAGGAASVGGASDVPVAHRFRKITLRSEDLTPGRCRERTRRTLEEGLAGAGILSRPLRPAGADRAWAVPLDSREALLDALRSMDLAGTEVRLYAGSLRLDRDGYSWRVGKDPVDLSTVTRLYIFRHYVGAGANGHLGHAAGVTVDLWSEDLARPGLWRGRIRNQEVDALRRDQFDVPLFTAWRPQQGAPLWSSVEVPIDAVYTWVDGRDPQWLERRAQVEPEQGPGRFAELAGGDVRYLNRDELRYSLRSIHAHAPWIRRIHLVTDGQRPSWLREVDDRIRVVDHRDLFPDPEVLPVFNSHAIETVLHRIPGLAEHFLYLNDDVLLMREQEASQYVTPMGLPRFFPSPTKINDLGDLSEPHESAGQRNRELLRARHGVSITQAMLHTPYPHRVSYLRELAEERYPEAIRRTRRARFRSGTDVSLVSSLAQYSGYLDKRYAQGSLRVGYVPLGAPDTEARLARAASGRLDVLAFGEANDDPDPVRTQRMATAFLRQKFPVPAPWEIPNS